MNTRLQEYTNQFKFLCDKFVIACDSIEGTQKWDKAKKGEMEGYYINNLLCVILKIMVSDNEIEEEEVRFINESLGLEMTKGKLEKIYSDSKTLVDKTFAEDFVAAVNLLKDINEKLADLYVEMFDTLAAVIAASDGEVEPSELKIYKDIKAML